VGKGRQYEAKAFYLDHEYRRYLPFYAKISGSYEFRLGTLGKKVTRTDGTNPALAKNH
jgi:hypothetical protein